MSVLDSRQAGHVRHWHNLAGQLPGDWSHMGAADPGQEWLDSYRYQLATMAYGALLAYRFYVPAAPGFIRPLVDSLIEKMMRRDVWEYWIQTSKSGPLLDPSITSDDDLLPEIHDPIGGREGNIMYSGHLALMTAWRDAAFGPRWDQPGAIRLVYDSVFQGMRSVKPEVYEYSTSSLLDTIYRQMIRTGMIGVSCEPNCSFLVCNQFPLIAFRLHDLRTGGNRGAEAAASYRWAWRQARGGFAQTDADPDGEAGLYPNWYRLRQGDILPASTIGTSTAWTNAWMHAWNAEFVESVYEAQLYGRLKDGDGGISLWAESVVPLTRAALADGAPLPDDDTGYTWTDPTFGYIAQMLAELGDPALTGLLTYADRHMNPTWERGGLYYPRRDDSYDSDGHMVYMDVLTGNAMLGFARILPPDGLRMIWNHTADLDERHPTIDEINYRDVDVLCAHYDPSARRLSWTMRTPPGQPERDVDLTIAHAPASAWAMTRDGDTIADSISDSTAARVDPASQPDQLHVRLPAPRSTTTYTLHWV